jgi:ABC-type amino acid transport substrate-binding protein
MVKGMHNDASVFPGQRLDRRLLSPRSRPGTRRLAVLLLFAGLATARHAEATTVADVTAHHQLVVLCFPDTNSPFLSRDKPGSYAGVDIAILHSFAARLHVPLVVHEVPTFTELLPAIARGEGDVAAGGLSITPERERIVDFSRPYFPVAIMVIARKGRGIKTLDDLAGKRAAAVPGTTHDTLMRQRGIVPAYALTRAGEAYQALADDKADFAYVDSTSGVVSLERYPKLVLVGMLPAADYYGFAVAKGSDLRGELDRHLAQIREQGLLYSIFTRELGAQAVKLYELFRQSTGAPNPLP